ncbi:MAG: TonB-dependent receptor [Gammaproteobacteria bacterium]|nr:TonB-dependent receptor [Gammaproteobacteria bacterium]
MAMRVRGSTLPWNPAAHAATKTKTSATVAAGVAVAASLGAPMPAVAQSSMIEEVIVTVSRRAETLQEVPLAVSAFTGEFMRDVNLDDVKDLVAYTPGLTGNSKDSFIDVLQIRGIYTLDFGVGGDPSISFFKNGLYQGRNGSVVTSLYDIDRVEVARGSQGFLFGRNSIAGAISTHTRRPELGQREAYVEVDIGERNHAVIEGAVSVDLSENAAARIALYSSQEDGYVKNHFRPQDEDLIAHNKQAARLSLRHTEGNTDINAFFEFEDREQSGTVYRAIDRGEVWENLAEIFGVTMRGDSQDTDSDLSEGEADDAKILSIGLNVEHDMGWATITSLTGFKDHEYYYSEDFDGSPLEINNYAQDQEGDYFEQEFRLVSETSNDLSWYAGVSYYQENIDTLFTQVAGEDEMCLYYYEGMTCSDYIGDSFTPHPRGLVENNRVKGDYSGWAAYVDLNYVFTPALDASIGLRYTSDTKDFANNVFPVESELGPFWAITFSTDGFLQDEKTWSDWTPRAVLRFRPNDDWTLYGSATTGYKSGGFGSFAFSPDQEAGTTGITQADAVPDPFDPETSISFEVGAKGTLLDGRAQVDGNFYHYTFEDLQVVIFNDGGGARVRNVGEVKGWGFEGTFQAILSENWDMFLSFAWADSEARDVSAICGDTDACEGNPLGRLPEYSYGAVLQGKLPTGAGEWVGRIEAFGQTKTYGGQELDPDTVNDGWVEVAVRGGYRANSGWELWAYVENLNDAEYHDFTTEGGDILPSTAFGMSRPTTFGVRAQWSFD